MGLSLTEHFSFVRYHLLIVSLIGVLFRKLSIVPVSSKPFPTFSSIRFSVSGFMLRCLIHLYQSFVKGDKYEYICILLHVNIQLFQDHLLKMRSSLLYCFGFFVKNQMSVRLWIYVLVYHLILLINVSIFMLIPHCFYYYSSVAGIEIRNGDASGSSFIVQDCFQLSWVFCFSK